MKGRKSLSCLLLGTLLLSACRTGGETITTAGTTSTQTVTPTTQTQPVTTTTVPATTPVTTPVTSHATTTAGSGGFDLGNLNRNHANGGLIAENDDWVWFVGFPDHQLKRMRPDGSDQAELGVNEVTSLNLTADSLYFVRATAEEYSGVLCEMTLDGVTMTQVSSARINTRASCILVDDWFYFVNRDAADRLYRMRIDGSDLEGLNDQMTSRLNTADGWIFCQTFTIGSGGEAASSELYRFRPDGSGAELLAQANFPLVLAHAGWIYYLDPQNVLHRMRPDGAQAELVLPGAHYAINADGDTLYYTDEGTDATMACDLDGSNPRVLVQRHLKNLQIAGDWLYGEDDSQRLYRLHLDGTGFAKAYQLEMVQPDPPGTTVVTGLGVDNANLAGDVQFASDGQWLYMADQSFAGGIIRMEADGSQRTRILERGGRFLNSVGDWLYFQDANAYGSLARVRTDGSGYGVIHDGVVLRLIVRDNWIYFIQDYAERSLWKIKTDGTGLTQLHAGPIARIWLAGDWVYYTGYLGDGPQTDGVWRVRTDGGFNEFLHDGPITSMTVSPDWIFYSREGAAGETKVYRMDLGGAFNRQVLTGNVLRLYGAVYDYVYYSTESSGGIHQPLNRSRLDGTDGEAVTLPASYAFLQFLDGKIMMVDNATGTYWRMNRDGSNAEELEEPEGT